MTFWGVKASGERMLLGEPMEAVLSFDREAPADLLRARFPADCLWEELREVLMYRDGELLFRGIVDEQNTTLSAEGLTTELVCRSLEALLLDNEAPPGVTGSPSFELLESRLLLPLGLRAGDVDKSRRQGELNVEKGESCWTVLNRFCQTYFGAQPTVDLDRRVQCGETAQKETELREIVSARVEMLPCKRLSEVWMQSCRGGYDTPFRGRQDSIPRRRYVSAQSGKDPRALLESAERESFLLTVTCRGAVWPGRSDTVGVTLPHVGRFTGCPIRSVRYRRDKNGEQTQLVLEKGVEEECG